MLSDRRRNVIFYVLLFFLWLIVGDFFEKRVVATAIYGLFNKELPLLGNYAITVVLAAIGWLATYFSRDYLKLIVSNGVKDHIDTLVKTASEDPYLIYAALISNTNAMREFVNKLHSLPGRPESHKVLIESYAKYAGSNQYLSDFKTFLQLGEILAINSNDMEFVNITAPYEWEFPFRYKRSEEIQQVTEGYRGTVFGRLQRKAMVRRITVVNDKEELTSVLKYGFKDYCKDRGINNYSRNLDPKELKASLEWIYKVVTTYQNKVSDSQILLQLLDFFRDLTEENVKNKFGQFVNEHLETPNFEMLSKEISQHILAKFILLHSPSEDSSLYIVKNNVLEEDKSIINSNYKDAGIFKYPDNNQYYLCLEKSDTIDVILITLKVAEFNDRQTFAKLKRIVDHDANRQREATGNSQDLLSELKVPSSNG